MPPPLLSTHILGQSHKQQGSKAPVRCMDSNMLKKTNHYLKRKKDATVSKDSLEQILLDRLSVLVEKEIENQEIQKEVLTAAKEQNEAFSPAETKKFMEQLTAFMEQMEQPNFSAAFFHHLQEQAKKESELT